MPRQLQNPALATVFGFHFARDASELLGEQYGELIVSLDEVSALDCEKVYLGETTADGNFVCGDESVSQGEATEAFCGTLEKVFPNTADADGCAKSVDFDCRGKRYENISTKTAKPRVFIPVFPGTNCELDTARMFRLAGAECEEVVVRNRSAADIEDSVRAISAAIARSNIIAFPGGFSGGDEPDGSGKFIATTFRNPYIAEQIQRLLEQRGRLDPRHLQRIPGSDQTRARAVWGNSSSHDRESDVDLQYHFPPCFDARRYPRGFESISLALRVPCRRRIHRSRFTWGGAYRSSCFSSRTDGGKRSDRDAVLRCVRSADDEVSVQSKWFFMGDRRDHLAGWQSVWQNGAYGTCRKRSV